MSCVLLSTLYHKNTKLDIIIMVILFYRWETQAHNFKELPKVPQQEGVVEPRLKSKQLFHPHISLTFSFPFSQN